MTETIFSVLKRPEREGNRSHLPSVEDKNTWSYTSNSPHVFMA